MVEELEIADKNHLKKK